MASGVATIQSVKVMMLFYSQTEIYRKASIMQDRVQKNFYTRFTFLVLLRDIFCCFPLAVECGSLVMPRNGSSYGKLATYPNKVYFQCDEGFIIKGSSLRTCQANGSWSGGDTSCEGV